MEACHRLCPQSELFPPAPQGVPGACTIDSLEGGSGSVSGLASASGADTIRWYRRPAGSAGAFEELGTSAPDEEVFFDALPPGNLEVKARGENEAGNGEESAVVTVTVT